MAKYPLVKTPDVNGTQYEAYQASLSDGRLLYVDRYLADLYAGGVDALIDLEVEFANQAIREQ